MVFCKQDFSMNEVDINNHKFSISCHGNYIDLSEGQEEAKIFKFLIPENIKIITYVDFNKKLLCKRNFQYNVCGIDDPNLNDNFAIFANPLNAYQNCYFPDLILSGSEGTSFKSGITHCGSNCIIYNIDHTENCTYTSLKDPQQKFFNESIDQESYNRFKECGSILLSEAIQKIQEFNIIKQIPSSILTEIHVLCCIEKLSVSNIDSFYRLTSKMINNKSILKLYEDNLKLENSRNSFVNDLIKDLPNQYFNDNSQFISSSGNPKEIIENFDLSYNLTYNSKFICKLKFKTEKLPQEEIDKTPFNFIIYLKNLLEYLRRMKSIVSNIEINSSYTNIDTFSILSLLKPNETLPPKIKYYKTTPDPKAKLENDNPNPSQNNSFSKIFPNSKRQILGNISNGERFKKMNSGKKKGSKYYSKKKNINFLLNKKFLIKNTKKYRFPNNNDKLNFN